MYTLLLEAVVPGADLRVGVDEYRGFAVYVDCGLAPARDLS